MAKINSRIVPCLWFDDQAEQAAALYTQVFPNSSIGSRTYFGEAGQELHGKPPGSVMTVMFNLDGQDFTALNGGPMFKFTEALSLQVICDTQAEIDHYWSKLGEGGDPEAQNCGWLKDPFGLSWQIVPRQLLELVTGPATARSQRVLNAVFEMKKLDISAIERAAE